MPYPSLLWALKYVPYTLAHTPVTQKICLATLEIDRNAVGTRDGLELDHFILADLGADSWLGLSELVRVIADPV